VFSFYFALLTVAYVSDKTKQKIGKYSCRQDLVLRHEAVSTILAGLSRLQIEHVKKSLTTAV
ncbi:MAG: hypothetical protein ACK53Y_13780, partial [bacterium]